MVRGELAYRPRKRLHLSERTAPPPVFDKFNTALQHDAATAIPNRFWHGSEPYDSSLDLALTTTYMVSV